MHGQNDYQVDVFCLQFFNSICRHDAQPTDQPVGTYHWWNWSYWGLQW